MDDEAQMPGVLPEAPPEDRKAGPEIFDDSLAQIQRFESREDGRAVFSTDGEFTAGTYHISLSKARDLYRSDDVKFSFLANFAGEGAGTTQQKRDFGQYMIDNEDYERELANGIIDYNRKFLQRKGVDFDNLEAHEIRALDSSLWNTGTNQPQLIRNVIGLNTSRREGYSPDIIEYFRVASARMMNSHTIAGQVSPGLVNRRLMEQDLFLLGEVDDKKYTFDESTRSKAKQAIRANTDEGVLAGQNARDFLRVGQSVPEVLYGTPSERFFGGIARKYKSLSDLYPAGIM